MVFRVRRRCRNGSAKASSSLAKVFDNAGAPIPWLASMPMVCEDLMACDNPMACADEMACAGPTTRDDPMAFAGTLACAALMAWPCLRRLAPVQRPAPTRWHATISWPPTIPWPAPIPPHALHSKCWSKSGYNDANWPDWMAGPGATASSMSVHLHAVFEKIVLGNSTAFYKVKEGESFNVDTLAPPDADAFFPQWYNTWGKNLRLDGSYCVL